MRATSGYLFVLLVVFAAPTLIGLAASSKSIWTLMVAALVVVLGAVFGMIWATLEDDLDD
jgi:hypothetical protein